MLGVDILISHSTQDTDLASNLADLLRGTLNLEVSRIHCTNANEDLHFAEEQARQQLFDANVFIALIPPASLQSSRVFFEMGARWKSSRPLLLIAASRDADLSGIPLYGHDVNFLGDLAQLKKLLNDVAILLNAEPVYSKQFSGLAEGLLKTANSNGKESRMLPSRISSTDDHKYQQSLRQITRQVTKILCEFDCPLFLTPFEAGLSLTELGGRIERIIDVIDRSDEIVGCDERPLIGPIRTLLGPLSRLITHMTASQASPIHGLVLDAARAQLIEQANVTSTAIGFNQYLDGKLLYIGVRSNPGIRYYLLESRIAEARQLVAEVTMPEELLSEYIEKLEELL